MSESISYQSCGSELKELFGKTAQNDAESLGTLAGILSDASPATSDEWQQEVTQFWTDGLADFARNNAIGRISDKAADLARAIKETVLSCDGVEGVYDLVLNNYGPDAFNEKINPFSTKKKARYDSQPGPTIIAGSLLHHWLFAPTRRRQDFAG